MTWNEKAVVDFLATGFYSGKMKPAPGTWGTLAAVPLALALNWLCGPKSVSYLFVTFLLVLGACWIAELHERYTGAHDPKEITIDEVVGFMITMAWLPATWEAYVGGFLVFRFFDILKPFPISYLDRNIEGGVGTIADDVLAGVFASLVLQIVSAKTAWLGVGASGNF
jgi:phosphatidylglycerophosphatase A